jgi:hypothetical protein
MTFSLRGEHLEQAIARLSSQLNGGTWRAGGAIETAGSSVDPRPPDRDPET